MLPVILPRISNVSHFYDVNCAGSATSEGVSFAEVPARLTAGSHHGKDVNRNALSAYFILALGVGEHT